MLMMHIPEQTPAWDVIDTAVVVALGILGVADIPESRAATHLRLEHAAHETVAHAGTGARVPEALELDHPAAKVNCSLP